VVAPVKPRLLDLFCGAGGAAMGYARAGFEVIGVDHRPQPEYPFEFIEMDVFEALRGAEGFDAIHASPPCQPFTAMRTLADAGGKRIRETSDHLEETRKRLVGIGVPYVIENVVGAPLINPVMLCGSSFGLALRRHRLFESSELIFGAPCRHADVPAPIAVYGDHPQQPGDKPYRIRRARTLLEGQEAMGIGWMSWKPLTQAIPPDYTEHIGRQLIRSVKAVA
jgi:DNA (cytosine-5)-methyltransferase 1